MTEVLAKPLDISKSMIGCPDPTNGLAVILPGAPGASFTQLITDSTGRPVDLTPYQTAPAGGLAYFADALRPCDTVHQGSFSILNATAGTVRITPPAAVLEAPGIYSAEIWVGSNVGASPVLNYQNKTLVSVEATLFTRKALGVTTAGPLTIGEIRLQLRDFPALNEYWGQHEFSLAELVHSILQPIYAWNETPPPIAKYDAGNFPFRQQWLEAASANLMKTAAAWLLRNARTIRYADGMTESDKDKFAQYLQIAEAKWGAYLSFCQSQKIGINLRNPPGVHGA